MAKFTVIVGDMTKHHVGMQVIPAWRAVQVQAPSPESAASLGEIEIASEIWHERYPERGEPYETAGSAWDEDWIACMEAVGVPVVIEGHVKTYIEDEIYA